MTDEDLIVIRRRAQDLRRGIHRRNLRESFAAGLVVASFAAIGLATDDLFARAGAAALALGAAVVAWNVARLGEPPPAEPATTPSEVVEQVRAELIHHADVLKAVPAWYLGPLVPGVAAWHLGGAWSGAWGPPWVNALSLSVCTAVFALVWRVNARASRSIRADAEALPRA